MDTRAGIKPDVATPTVIPEKKAKAAGQIIRGNSLNGGTLDISSALWKIFARRNHSVITITVGVGAKMQFNEAITSSALVESCKDRKAAVIAPAVALIITLTLCLIGQRLSSAVDEPNIPESFTAK